MRKIIILPSFASSHLLKCSIPNWIDIIEPDIILINEGLFPEGPENKGHIDDEFRQKWCHCDYWTHKENDHLIDVSNVGFDWNETLDFVANLIKEKHEGNSKIPHIEVRTINYKNTDVNECFLEAISNPDIFITGDIIFPLEPDVLFHQDDKEKIHKLISEVKAGEGLQCAWKDFLETQFYVEAINEVSPKWRRFCYCFDTMKNYRSAMNAFMSQNYSKLKKATDFFAFHYPWFVSGKWKELRYELIYRKDPQYWKDFDIGLEWIKLKSEIFIKRENKGNLNYEEPDSVMIRPSRTDEGKYAKFVNISHPKHIENHPNWIK